MEYDYKLNVEFLKEYRLKILPNKSWTCDQIFFKNWSVFNEKTPTTLPPTSPVKVQQVYIKQVYINVNNNRISQQNPR